MTKDNIQVKISFKNSCHVKLTEAGPSFLIHPNLAVSSPYLISSYNSKKKSLIFFLKEPFCLFFSFLVMNDIWCECG